ncbi:MAG: sigma 54-interacting transcriptional regulator, partial [candidate division NC10 bacterium]|nr:sigma 54-interacting transcriptional regulator [candidate division NC10 bacterium]
MPIQTEPLSVLDILRSIPDSVLTIDRDKRIVSLTGPAEALTGTAEIAAGGRACGAVLKSEICDTDRCPFDRSFIGGETVTNFNVLMRDAAGEKTPICINTSPLKNGKGEVVGVVETIRVVSHINRLIEELREQRNKVQAVLDSIAEGVFTVDRDGRITSVNRMAERILGYPAGEVLERPCQDVYPQEICGPGSSLHETLQGGRQVRNREVTVADRHGTAVPLSLSTGPFRDEAGTTLGAVCTIRDLREIERIAEERRSRTPFVGIVGKHPRIREVFDLVEMIKDSDSTVLLQGESGTGKGLFAQALHSRSPRRRHPFVKVSCAALPETLLESELFGHEKGAFTGAIKDRKGRFELADKGTIFLDEIGDLSPSVQVKLLRVLQEQEFERLGGTQTIKVDVRVIAATHRDLRQLMREGKFREGLFCRLNVIPVHLPPLRERKADTPLLVEFLLDRFAAKGKGKATSVSPRTMAILMDHLWPGNVRELENVLEHAMVCSRGNVIEPEALPRSLLTGPADLTSHAATSERPPERPSAGPA